MNRRRFLAASCALLPSVAGCVGSDDGPTTDGGRTTTTDGPSTTGPAVNSSGERQESTGVGEEATEESDDSGGRTGTPPGEPPLAPSGEWPTYRFDAGNTGYEPDGSGLRSAEVYWRLHPTSAATVADGRLYATDGEGDGDGVFSVRDPETAAVVRRGDVPGTNAHVPPVVADGRAVLTHGPGVTCVDAETAERRWEAGGELSVPDVVTVRDGRVFVGSAVFEERPASVVSFDLHTGDRRWGTELDSNLLSAVAVGEDLVFASSNDGLHALDAATGEQRYVLDARGSSTPVVRDGTVYTVDEGDALDEEDATELLAVDAASGEVRWRTGPVSAGTPVVSSDLVHVSSVEAGLFALDVRDGSRAVDYADEVADAHYYHGGPVGRVGNVLYSRRDGAVVAHDADSGRRLWSVETRSEVHHLTPITDAVYVTARDGFYGIGPA